MRKQLTVSVFANLDNEAVGYLATYSTNLQAVYAQEQQNHINIM